MTLPSEQTMQTAIKMRDKSFDGQFYYAVLTTGIFCRPSCSSKHAKSQNLRFYPSVASAMVAGFRACKRCQPTSHNPQVNKLVEMAKYIESHFDERLTLADLGKQANMSPSRFQRVFKDALGVSPKVFQEGIRLKHYKQSLKQGEAVTDAIYSSGYGSSSRIYGETKRLMGMTPKTYSAGSAGEEISYAYRTSSLGSLMMAATQKGVCFVQFGEDEGSLITMLKGEFPQAALIKSSAQNSEFLDDWMDALEQHISSGAPRPDLPLDLRGTAFQIKVWCFLLSVQDGDVLSYSELAKSIGKPKAFRAVATACGKNRIGVLIPCHRILRGDGSLGGYRWGLERKQALLDAEQNRKT